MLSWLAGTLAAQTVPTGIPAFPGAEGFGAMASGGRGGLVLEVTNLEDDGPGSLREAVEASGARTVVFRVSGTITLKSRLSIRNDNITIAGHTAPGDGICLRDYETNIDANNVIIRHLRFRLGSEGGQQHDAINGREKSNIIIDHCSMSWSVDETASFYDNENFTMQWCLISESLYNSIHEKGFHGYGGIWGGMGASFHHNLLAHHSSRNPRFNGSRYHGDPEAEVVDFRNNVIYNWGFNSAYGGEEGNHNMLGNYFKAGPATSSGEKQYRIINPSTPYGLWFISGNLTEGFPLATEDNWAYGVQGPSDSEKEAIRSDHPFEAPQISASDTSEVFNKVMGGAGATLPKRDPVDERIIIETKTGTATYGGTYGDGGKGIIDSQDEVGGWPILLTYDAPDDTDHDGMPDQWESAKGLDLNDPGDRNLVAEGQVYTNLENYLNELASDTSYLLRPLNLNASYKEGPEVELNWLDVSQLETGFAIERKKNGTFEQIGTVDADVTNYTDSNVGNRNSYTYRVYAFNNKLQSLYSDTSSITIVTGVKKEMTVNFIRAFPNPVVDLLHLSFKSAPPGSVRIEIFNIAGLQVQISQDQVIDSGQKSLTLGMGHLETGVYFIKVTNEQGWSQHLHVVKQ